MQILESRGLYNVLLFICICHWSKPTRSAICIARIEREEEILIRNNRRFIIDKWLFAYIYIQLLDDIYLPEHGRNNKSWCCCIQLHSFIYYDRLLQIYLFIIRWHCYFPVYYSAQQKRAISINQYIYIYNRSYNPTYKVNL